MPTWQLLTCPHILSSQIIEQTMRTKQTVTNGYYSYNADGQLHVHDEGAFFKVPEHVALCT
jgi:hypothetical protein